MSAYIIELLAEHDADGAHDGVDAHALERLAARALDAETVPKPAELSIVLADDPTVHELNRAYRGTDAPTDVLSFAQGEGEQFARPEGTAAHLGDVIISLDTAQRQAAEHNIALQDEVGHLLVHGILHLLGYDHEEADDAEQMRLREEAILGAAHHH
jgi:probable rRNA maturation factor